MGYHCQVLKRLSNPLSWMDGFGGDTSGSSAQGSGSVPSGGSGGTPPIPGVQPSSLQQPPQDPNDPKAGGVLSSMFNMTSNVTSNVSNMLTR